MASLLAWLEAAGIPEDPEEPGESSSQATMFVFRPVHRNGATVAKRGMSEAAINNAVQRACMRALVPEARSYSAHSLRAGFATYVAQVASRQQYSYPLTQRYRPPLPVEDRFAVSGPRVRARPVSPVPQVPLREDVFAPPSGGPDLAENARLSSHSQIRYGPSSGSAAPVVVEAILPAPGPRLEGRPFDQNVHGGEILLPAHSHREGQRLARQAAGKGSSCQGIPMSSR